MPDVCPFRGEPVVFEDVDDEVFTSLEYTVTAGLCSEVNTEQPASIRDNNIAGIKLRTFTAILEFDTRAEADIQAAHVITVSKVHKI